MNDPVTQVSQELSDTPVDALVLVDFDETLIFENSTEAYLATSRPLIVAALVSKLVVKLRLCALLPGPNKVFVWQDWLRVLLTTIILPWTLPLWHYVHAPRLARRATNQPLLDLLAKRPDGRVVVCSHGFSPILRPVLRHMAPKMPLFASPLFGSPKTRRQGKRKILEQACGPEAVAGATFVSDGAHDSALLEAVARPIIARWPETDVRSAFSRLYLPFLYTERAQPASRRHYIFSGLLLYDVPVIAFAYAWGLAHPLLGAVGFALMHLGLWCIYELGYLENGRFAYEKREVGGTIPEGYAAYAPRVHATSAWLFALLMSGIGLVLVLAARHSGGIDLWHGWAEFGMALAVWAVFLAGGRTLFAIYNRSPTSLRFIQYPLLHGFRFFGYALFVPTNIVGAMLILSMIFGRWMPYLIYRLTGIRNGSRTRLIIVVAFTLTIPLALAVAPEEALSWQVLAALAWLVFRASKDIRALVLNPPTIPTTKPG